MSYELPPKGEVYIPYQQFIFATFMSTIVVRTEGEPAAWLRPLKSRFGRSTRTSPLSKWKRWKR